MDYLQRPLDNLRDDLDALNRDWRDLKGSELSAAQCYHFESDPPHFLFNLNCPDDLRRELQSLLAKHFPETVKDIHKI